MSLLMKALEKAAKDRGDAQQKAPDAAAPGMAPSAPPVPPTPPAPAPAPSAPVKKAPASELTLEPLASAMPQPAKPKPAAAATGKPSNTGSSGRDQARAATVMQASAATTTGPRIRPVLAIGVIAGVVALGLAVYVYLQITNPGIFIPQQPAPTRPPTPLAQGPAPVQPPIVTGAVIAPADTTSRPTTEVPRELEPPPAPRAVARAPATAMAPAEQRNSIRVSTGTPVAQLDSRLPQAYSALQSGKLDVARQLYGDVARAEPKNVNAQLGLAAIAMQEGKADDASRLYFGVLDLEPRNAYAQTGLIALMGRADPVAAETRLKQLIAREPIASLYFTLGNLYGDQSRWAEAQLAYFQAHQLEPANPDYAYNLAVGLEHVGQSKLAAGFYQQAVSQAQAKGRAGFNLGQAQDRIRQLAVRPE